MLAASSLSHGACGGLLFDELDDDEFNDDDVLVFDGAENDDNNVDNVDDLEVFADVICCSNLNESSFLLLALIVEALLCAELE